jgi:uncharacterized delta-60 repeat protein
VIAGNCQGASNFDFCAIRFNANGSLDASFSSDGKVIVDMGAAVDVANAIAIQPDGKIVLTGSCGNSPNAQFCALRFNADGSLDTTFDGDGKVLTTVNSSADSAKALALQPDGKLILAGHCANSTNLVDFCAIRYNPNGTLDTTFNGNGIVVTTVGVSSFDFGNAMALAPDGKIVIAGECDGATNKDFCAIRYDGGPFGFRNCKFDLDGDNVVLSTTDLLIGTRIGQGMSGNAVLGGITFAPHAKRTTWPAIREYLVTQCQMSLPQ